MEGEERVGSSEVCQGEKRSAVGGALQKRDGDSAEKAGRALRTTRVTRVAPRARSDAARAAQEQMRPAQAHTPAPPPLPTPPRALEVMEIPPIADMLPQGLGAVQVASHGNMKPTAATDESGARPSSGSGRKRKRASIPLLAPPGAPAAHCRHRAALAAAASGISAPLAAPVSLGGIGGLGSTANDGLHLRSVDGGDKSCSVCGERSVERNGPRFAASDQADGHLAFRLGDSLLEKETDGTLWPTGRYQIVGLLGEGTFGRVVECWDRKLHRAVAVKIVRALRKYTQAARVEVQVLESLRDRDPRGCFHCVELLSWFDYRGHVCMVFEKLGANLYECLRRRKFYPFSMDTLRCYAFQILEAVEFAHSMNLVHTDLKPENVLLLHDDSCLDEGPDMFENQRLNKAWKRKSLVPVSHSRRNDAFAGDSTSNAQKQTELANVPPASAMPRTVDRLESSIEPTSLEEEAGVDISWEFYERKAVRLIDFGSAVMNRKNQDFVVSTRHYRAPEVILGLGWSFSCDLWSVGCILAELYTGRVLFQTHENLEHLSMMCALLGPMPQGMKRAACSRNSGSASRYFVTDEDGVCRLKWPEGAADSQSLLAVEHMIDLSQLCKMRSLLTNSRRKNKLEDSCLRKDMEDHLLFRSLLEKLLAFEPSDRFTCSQALQHAFFAPLRKYSALKKRDAPVASSASCVPVYSRALISPSSSLCQSSVLTRAPKRSRRRGSSTDAKRSSKRNSVGDGARRSTTREGRQASTVPAEDTSPPSPTTDA